MGVRGLNTLVNQIRGSVSKTHVLPIQGSSTHPPASANHVAPNDSSTASSSTPVPPPRRCVVVDFWAFVFWTSEILDARLAKQTWIQGGYYAEHEALVKEIISLWLSAGLWPIFVADGPTPPNKQDTVDQRLQDLTSRVIEFMRSSPNSTSRNSLPFQRANRILPIFSYRTVLAAVHSFDPTYFPIQMSSDFISQIDRSKPALRFVAREADFETASLAMMFNGIVLSQDSDYFVLCAQDKTCGYAPFADLSFTVTPEVSAAAATPVENDDNDGFTTASSSRKKKVAPSATSSTNAAPLDRAPCPPTDISRVTAVNIIVYSGKALATQLGIPPNLLTLLAALMGNDYVNFSSLIFRNSRASMDSSSRLYYLARVIKDCWTRFNLQAKARSLQNVSGILTPATSGTATPTAPMTPGRSNFKPTTKPSSLNTEALVNELLDPAKSLVHRILDRVLEDSSVDWLSSGEVSDMADQLLAAMSAYTTSAQDSLLHAQERELARFLKGHYEGLIEQRDDSPQVPLSPERVAILDAYREAYLEGYFPTSTLGVMLYRRYLSNSLLEDVSQASVSQTYCQPLRLWLYAVLFSAFGLEWAQTPEDDVRDEQRKIDAARRRAEREEYLDEVVSLHSESTGSDDDHLPSDVDDSEDDNEGFVLARKPDPVVIEMLRRGDRAGVVPVPIPSLSQMAQSAEVPTSEPLDCAMSHDQRLALYLAAHTSASPQIIALQPALQTLVAVLRHIVKVTAERTASRTLWWKQHEVRGALLMGLLMVSKQPYDEIARKAPAMPTNAVIHSAAVYQGTLEASIMLREALRLEHVQPHTLYHGGLWHALVLNAEHHAAAADLVDQALLNHLMELVAGNEGFVYAGPSRDERKARKKQDKEQQQQQRQASSESTAARFSLLEVS